MPGRVRAKRQPSQMEPTEDLSNGWEVLLNPTPEDIGRVLARLQKRARRHLISADDAEHALRKVNRGDVETESLGFRSCPWAFEYGITTTAMVVTRLFDDQIACAIGRFMVKPGTALPLPIDAHRHFDPVQWTNQVVTLYWSGLPADFVTRMEQESCGAVLAAATGLQRRKGVSNHDALRRRLQLRALFRRGEPQYLSELSEQALLISKGMKESGEGQVRWGDFQKRWPGFTARYRRELLAVVRNGVVSPHDLTAFEDAGPRYALRYSTWNGQQRIFEVPQLRVWVGSAALELENTPEAADRDRARQVVRKERNRWHNTAFTDVGWIRVHLDDINRIAFVDEVQSDALESLRRCKGDEAAAAKSLVKELEDWHLHVFSTLRHWARGIGFRIATHSRSTFSPKSGRSPSERKWNLYYGSLIRRFGLQETEVSGYPASIHLDTA